jgi:hypothetical protein
VPRSKRVKHSGEEGERERKRGRTRKDGNGEPGDMGWRIEVAAGLGFLAVGLIQAFKHMKKMRARKSGFVAHRNRQKSRFHDLDLYTILVLCIVHILFDMAVIHHEERKSHGFAAAVNVERLGVVSLFLLYSVVALIVENHRVLLPVPSEVVKLLAMFAFGQEFLSSITISCLCPLEYVLLPRVPRSLIPTLICFPCFVAWLLCCKARGFSKLQRRCLPSGSRKVAC